MFKLKGNSGCKLRLYEKMGKKSIVRKTTSGPDYSFRLKSQATKQADFKKSRNIFTPQILEKSFETEPAYFDMEYVGGMDFVSFTCGCSKQSLDEALNTLIRFINKNLTNSLWIDFPLAAYEKKVYDTLKIVNDQQKISKSFSLIVENFLINNSYVEKFPSGYCHGDLTLSNVIVIERDSKLALIDFLDLDFDSPLHDIVKLRQDTRYYWTLKLFEGQVDTTKVKIAWDYLDKKIQKEFFENKSTLPYYSIIQVLNFLRILKYTSTKEMDNFVVDCIKDIIGEQ